MSEVIVVPEMVEAPVKVEAPEMVKYLFFTNESGRCSFAGPYLPDEIAAMVRYFTALLRFLDHYGDYDELGECTEIEVVDWPADKEFSHEPTEVKDEDDLQEVKLIWEQIHEVFPFSEELVEYVVLVKELEDEERDDFPEEFKRKEKLEKLHYFHHFDDGSGLIYIYLLLKIQSDPDKFFGRKLKKSELFEISDDDAGYFSQVPKVYRKSPEDLEVSDAKRIKKE